MAIVAPRHDISFTAHLPKRLRAVRWLMARAIRTTFGVRVVGAEHVPAGNYLVVANHLSWIDPFLLLVCLPAEPRIYFLGAQQAINRHWKARLMHSVDIMIPVERGARWMGKNAFSRPLQVLQQGAVLALFPEGRLGAREGELQDLQHGVGHILARVDVPVLPIALSGVHELYWRKPLTLMIGEPFHVQTAGLDHHAAITAADGQVEAALRQLLPGYAEPQVAHKRMRFLTNLLG